MLNIGIIGYGNRMRDVIRTLMRVRGNEVAVCAVADPDTEAARANARENGNEDCRFYTTAEEMLEHETLDGVCIGTRCSLHTKYALLVAERGIPMFLEKPVATNYGDLERLRTILYHSDKTVVSFPLRLTEPVIFMKGLVDGGKIGTIEHVQAYNNVSYGRGYYHKWYRDDAETGGLFLQKATHDLDYINFMLSGRRPTCVCAMKSKQIFKGNKPAGLKCADCAEAKTCPESPENVAKLNDGYVIGPYCCFAEDTGNEDSGSVIVEYDSGMHVVYSQNFVVRGDAGKRGARFIGYEGTMEFDFNTGKITVYHHLTRMTEEYRFALGKGHFGGDARLAQNFVDVMKGEAVSQTPLSEGILSAEMCLAAKESAETKRFVEIRGD